MSTRTLLLMAATALGGLLVLDWWPALTLPIGLVSIVLAIVVVVGAWREVGLEFERDR